MGVCVKEKEPVVEDTSFTTIVLTFLGILLFLFSVWLVCILYTRTRKSKTSISLPKKENKIETESIQTDGRVIHDTENDREGNNSAQQLMQSISHSEN